MAYDEISNEANKSANTQNILSNVLLQKLQGLNQPYQQDIAGQAAATQSGIAGQGQGYLSQLGQAANANGLNLSNQNIQQNLQGNQGVLQQLRESLAASGGLQRGGADAQFQQNAQNLQNNIAQGQNAIQNQTLAGQIGAMGSVYGNNVNQANTSLGLNTGASNTVLGNTASALNNNTNSLLGIEQNRSNSVQNAQLGGINNSMAQGMAANQNQSALLGAGITAAGTALGGPLGGLAANRLAQSSLGKSPNTPNTDQYGRGIVGQ